MSTPYLAEIRIFSFTFAPTGWALCNGQLLAINQNQALFALVGTLYGGNGIQTFALPNLQGRVPMHFSNAFVQGQTGGEESHTLTATEMPAHTHAPSGTTNVADSFAPNGNLPAVTSPALIYSAGSSNMTAMSPQMVNLFGGSQSHENRQPFLVMNYCIALQGIFPSRN